MTWRLDDFDYPLSPERIAQQPAEPRDAARLLVVDRSGGGLQHGRVRELGRWLRPGDLLVGNATRVRPARLRGHKASGGRAEALLLAPGAGPGEFRALVRCSGRLRPGLRLCFEAAGPQESAGEGVGEARPPALEAELAALAADGEAILRFAPESDPYGFGEMPLPPYIRREAADPRDRERYQTVFAREPGSVAAPTAGLHLTRALLDGLRSQGIGWAEVVLHVGPGTFRPVGEEALARGELYPERYHLPGATVSAIEGARARGARVVAVGTTTCRVLEACAAPDGTLRPGSGETRLFLRPGSSFRSVDALLTNFHLPRSSLLLLVAAFAGWETVRDAYQEAIEREYRFYSYGDAMLIL
ncbi:MAG: tRNA preQ1(34) S-adenosylmethionine ribosyltransferase-isomerase QueA [Deltaproteobacteria bacterium]|jgi:S-adenosylmethionine:tRNA ribosyltransferase-isomerase|nr:tRNA preQ1(34) S-adenosylmethionine ribosyltransferase-isomerase QueA [Deltaproteobacteria bacterium]